MPASLPTTNGNLHNGVGEPHRTPAPAHDNGLDYDSATSGRVAPTPFPALTGLRPRATTGQQSSVSLDTSISIERLCSLTARLGVYPITALQLTWAIILNAYTSNQEEIIFITATPQAEGNLSNGSNGAIRHPKPRQTRLGLSEGRIKLSVKRLLQELAESDPSSPCVEQTFGTKQDQHDQSQYASTVAFTQDSSTKLRESSSWLSSSPGVRVLLRPNAAGRLTFSVVYTDLLLNQSSAVMVLKQIEDLLTFILAYPDEPIDSYLSAIRPSLLSTSNKDMEEAGLVEHHFHGLHHQFENFARSSPDRVALIFEEDLKTTDPSINVSCTYRELDQKAQHLANYLVDRFRLLADNVVPICMDRRPDLFIAVLGILKAGGAWSPIDPSFPARRRHDLIARTQAKFILVAERQNMDDTVGVPEGVEWVDITQIGSCSATPPPIPRIKPSHLAYLIWTSGTTGDPKGVPISHGAAVASMQAIQKSIPADIEGGTVRCLQFSQFTFDVFVQDLFYTWGIGGTLVGSTRAIMLGSFAQLATKTQATHAHLTPAFAASVERRNCPTLQVITMIGEKLTQVVADDWSQNMRAYNTYGPAETTVVSTFRRFGGPGDEIQSHNIGYPLPSVSAFIMRNSHPVIRQGIGELALGGPQLAEGYWHDPSKSSERFVWNEQYNRFLYMTGDVVRQLHDGSIEFVGRTDDLIKIQGIRIELSEIAFALRRCHSGVEQVNVQYLQRQDRPSNVLVAFLAVPQPSHEGKAAVLTLTSEDAAQICKEALEKAKTSLPEYMIPNVFIVVNAIPRTSSAKVDRAVLKAVYEKMDIGSWEEKLAFHNGIDQMLDSHEVEILQMLAEISGTSQASISSASTLASIGVDSIRVAKLVTMLNTIGLSLSVIDILRCQNVRDILTLTNRASAQSSSSRYPMESFHDRWWPMVRGITGVRDAIVVPTLPIQEALLSETMQNPSAYWGHAVFALGTDIEIPRLRKAWLQVAGDTDALRSAFFPTAELSKDLAEEAFSDSVFLQLIYQEPMLDMDILQPGKISLENQVHQRLQRIAKSCRESYFRSPLWAVTVLDEPERRAMILTTHHSIRDEPSLEYILADVYQTYHTHERHSAHRRQFRQALEILLPSTDQLAQDEVFWAKELQDYAGQDNQTWPDLTGRRAVEGTQTAGFLMQAKQMTTSYADLSDAAMNLGASSVASLFRLAWSCILIGYLEAETIVFGETNSDRINFPALEDSVGPFVNVLPVPFKALGSVRQMLSAQSDFQLESRAHRSIHPRVIRKLLGRSRTDILYPAIFNYVPEMPDVNNSVPWKRLEDLSKPTVEHPVALNVTQASNGTLHLEIVASERIVNPSHAMLLAQQVEALVHTMIEWPELPAREIMSKLPSYLLSISSVATSKTVTDAHYQDPTHWVAYNARKHPSWLAVQITSSLEDPVPIGEEWTYRELHEASDRVAMFIRRVGHSGKMIAMCLDNRLEVYTVLLGILRSGNTYLPIDQSLPSERKSFLLRDSAAVMLFTTTKIAAEFSDQTSKCHTICVDRINDLDLYCEAVPTEATHLGYGDNAYLLYTSGSTGTPKGVLVSRGNLSSFVEGLSEYINPRTPDHGKLPGRGRYLGLASRAFDVHLAETFLAWRRGMAVVTAPRAVLLDDLEMALRKLRITHASFVPSLIDHAGLNPDNLPNIRYLGIGGEKMSSLVIDTWASNNNVCVANPYGPTELSIGCCVAQVTPQSNARNVGRPFGNSVAHVLSPGSNEYTMRGISGELCMTGDLVAKGYLNRPDAKGFIEDFHGCRMYRTGDIVRLMADDSVEFIGRQDDQTKIRGQRLELGEVSGAIRSFAKRALSLANTEVVSAVLQRSDVSRPKLISFVVPNRFASQAQDCPAILSSTDAHHLGEKIHAHCEETLPTYMVPDAVVPLTALPIAPSSGKADMKSLKTIFSSLPIEYMMTDASSGVSDPIGNTTRELSEAEKSVRGAVSATLGIPKIGVLSGTNTFRLGLDSLSAISLAIRLQRLGYVCTVADVLKNPVIEQLALLKRSPADNKGTLGKLEQARKGLLGLEARFRATLHTLDASAIAAVRPCLPLQESLVASSLSDRRSPLYINHLSFRLSTKVNHDRLLRAWEKTIAELDILRTCFPEFENGFAQVVLKLDDIRSRYWKAIEGSDSDIDFYQEELSEDIISNISTDTPLRLVLIKSSSGDGHSTLLISIHHALYDGESLPMLLSEIYARYHCTPLQARTPFSALLEYVASQDIEQSRMFWVDYLADYHTPASLRQGERLAHDQTMASKLPLRNRLSEVTNLASSFSCTTASIIQAVFGVVLAQLLDIEDVVFGVVLSGRTVPIENPNTILAPCTTTIPQRVDLRCHGPSVTDLVVKASERSTSSLEFQHTALRNIHQWVKADRPLFECLFSFIHKQKPEDQSDLWTEAKTSMPAEFPFAVGIQADMATDQLISNCTFTSQFGGVDRVQAFVEEMDIILTALIRQDEISITSSKITTANSSKPTLAEPKLDEIPETTEMKRLKEIVSELCGVKIADVSSRVSFFSLGIDSIIAIRFARMLRQNGIHCSSADIMRYPSILALTEHITALPDSQSNSIKRDSVRSEELRNRANQLEATTYPCTPLQSSMLTQTLGSDGKLYANHHVFHLLEPSFTTMLKNSWDFVVRKTEILRTSFHFSKELNNWVASVNEDYVGVWDKIDDVAPIASSLSRVVDKFIFRGDTDFSTPPWKVTIVKDPKETAFVLSMHHSLYDGESIRLLLNDLTRVYRAIDIVPGPAFSQAAKEITTGRAEADAFWTKRIDDFTGSSATDDPIPTNTAVTEIETTLEIDLGAVLRKCKELGVTLQTFALFAFGKTLAMTSKRRDVVFGHLIGGRSLAVSEAEGIIGPLFNTVPFRLSFDDSSRTNVDVLSDIQRFSGESLPYQHASLGKVQQIWRQKPGNADSRLFDSLFVFQKTTSKDSPFSKIMEPFDTSTTTAPTEYQTNLEFEQRDHKIVLQMIARKTQKNVSDWLAQFQEVFQHLIDDPNESVVSHPMSFQDLPLAVRKDKREDRLQEDVSSGQDLDCVRNVLAGASGRSAESIQPQTSIYALGLDSISTIRVAATCRKIGLSIGVADVLQGQTLGGICKRLRAKKLEQTTQPNAHGSLVSNESSSRALKIIDTPENAEEDVLPCLSGQIYHLGMWLRSNRTMCEATITYRCSMRLDAEKLRSAWRNLKQNHPILRTVPVVVSPQEAVQVVLKEPLNSNDSMQVLEIPDSSDDNVLKMVQQTLQESFDLLTTPAKLTMLHGKQEDCILLKLHHVLYDAYTVETLVRELALSYQEAKSSSLPTLRPFMEHVFKSRDNKAAKRYWRQSLQNKIPTILQTSADQSTPSASSAMPSSSKNAILQLHDLEKATQSLSFSLPIILLLAYARVLSRHTEQPSPTFGFFQTGRFSTFEGVDKICAPLLNVTPLQVSNALEQSALVAARALQFDLAERVPFEQNSLREIYAYAGIEEGMPMFNCYINISWQDSPRSASSDKQSLFTPWEVGTPSDFLHLERAPVGKTAVDALDTSFLAKENLFFDVKCDRERDVVDFGIRCDGGVMNEDGVRKFMGGIADEVRWLVGEMEKESEGHQ